MYLKNALILNSGPLQNLEIQFQFGENGNPKPTVLVGKNGSGKSNLISHLTDALIEIAAKKFSDVAPAYASGGHVWHRVIGHATIRTGSDHELALLKFEHEEVSYTYVSKGGKIKKSDVADRLVNFPQAPNWPEEGPHKNIHGPDEGIEEIFRNGCYVSFPTDRTEKPYWSGKTLKRDDASFDERFVNILSKPISVKSSISELRPWLVDVLLDQMVDANVILRDPQNATPVLVKAAANNTALANVNSLLKAILGDSAMRLVRTGRQEGSRKLMVFKGNELALPSLDSF